MNRSNYVAFAISVLLSACSGVLLGPEPTNDPESVFEHFWQQIDQNYSGLTVRPVDWDSLYRVYRSQINGQTTNDRLIAVFQAMIVPFRDNHVAFYVGGRGYGSYEVDTRTIPDYLGQGIVERYAGKRLTNYRNLFFYEKLTDSIGYVAISTFSQQAYTRQHFDYFGQILEELKDTKGLIIDLRFNGGGNEEYAQTVASHFATQPRLYKYTRTKIGPGRLAYSDYAGSTLYPRDDNSRQYNKPVVVLTNERVFSTGNNFLLMMLAQPIVTTVGTTSGDGVNGPITRELPNGGLLNIPSGLAYLPNKTVVEGQGIPPQINVTITAEDRKNGRDTILEKALALLK